MAERQLADAEKQASLDLVAKAHEAFNVYRGVPHEYYKPEYQVRGFQAHHNDVDLNFPVLPEELAVAPDFIQQAAKLLQLGNEPAVSVWMLADAFKPHDGHLSLTLSDSTWPAGRRNSLVLDAYGHSKLNFKDGAFGPTRVLSETSSGTGIPEDVLNFGQTFVQETLENGGRNTLANSEVAKYLLDFAK